MRQFFNPYNLPVAFPPQHQPWQPGIEGIMVPRPISEPPYIEKSGEKLLNKVAGLLRIPLQKKEQILESFIITNM